MKKIVSLLLCMCLLGVLIGTAIAEDVLLVSCEWQPYTGETLLNYGFTAEIIAKAFERVGYTANFRIVPWNRAMFESETGKADALYSAYYSEDRAQTYALSEPYAQSPLMFCARKDKEIQYKELRDLAPYRIGVVNGYVNTPEFDQADYLTKDEAISDLLNLRKLLKGRVDLIVIDKYVAIHLLKNDPTIEGTLNDVKFLEPPLDMKPLYVMFSKAIPGYEKKLADFNRGLKEITEDGTFQEILEKYGFLVD